MRLSPQLNGISGIRKFLFFLIISITLCILVSRELTITSPELAWYLDIASWIMFVTVLISLFIARKQEKSQKK